jgi:hypothetical protein
MKLDFRAQESSLLEIFSAGQRLAMPPYQRSYSWDQDQAMDLLHDLQEATEARLPHFIGAVVFVRGHEDGLLEIVDGQQRLTTLTILLCVLRDLETDDLQAKKLHALVADDSNPIFGGGQSWRLTLNHLDGPFFLHVIQTPGSTRQIDGEQVESESQRKMVGNTVALRDAIRRMSEAERRALAETAINGCGLVRVIVDDREQGFKVFRVLNTRGKEPDAHDVIKTELFQRARFSPAEAERQSERWIEHEAALGGAAFDDLLRQIRAIYDRSSKGDVSVGFAKAVLGKTDARTFLETSLPVFVFAYRIVETGQIAPGLRNADTLTDKLNQLRALDQQTWRAPAIKFLVDYGIEHPQAPQFFAGLERLAYIIQLTTHDRDNRQRRISKVLEAISNDRLLFSKSGPFAVDRAEAKKVRERLSGRFASFGQRRALALRLNAAIEGGRTLPPEADATVEHVLPRNINDDSHWMTIWPDAARRREQCDTLGNFVLLTHKTNQKADRLDFHAKKVIYFDQQGGAEFALTRDLRDQNAWTPDVVRKRTERLADILMHAWEL